MSKQNIRSRRGHRVVAKLFGIHWTFTVIGWIMLLFLLFFNTRGDGIRDKGKSGFSSTDGGTDGAEGIKEKLARAQDNANSGFLAITNSDSEVSILEQGDERSKTSAEGRTFLNNINAMQYREYGAGLFKQNAARELSSDMVVDEVGPQDDAQHLQTYYDVEENENLEKRALHISNLGACYMSFYGRQTCDLRENRICSTCRSFSSQNHDRDVPVGPGDIEIEKCQQGHTVLGLGDSIMANERQAFLGDTVDNKHDSVVKPEVEVSENETPPAADANADKDSKKEQMTELSNQQAKDFISEGKETPISKETDKALPDELHAELCNDMSMSQNLSENIMTAADTATDLQLDFLVKQPDTSRHSRAAPVGLDEYRKQSGLDMQKVLESEDGNAFEIHHRCEPGGREYNYAASSHGAKVLASNKEAKGAKNILDDDKDSYFRTPCSAEEKYVILELAQETLVDTLVIANYEFYSSNMKDFELLGSKIFPTEDWNFLGKFQAENVRQSQRFTLPKPQWVRYLKLQMLTHYGAEFYCTLSMIEVFGVDAIERLLEDWIYKEDASLNGHMSDSNHVLEDPGLPISTTLPSQSESDTGNGLHKSPVANAFSAGVSGDSVLKLLMQKVKSLELNQAVLDRYLEDLNSNYKAMFADFDQDLGTLNGTIQNLTTSSGHIMTHLHNMQTIWEAKYESMKSQHFENFDALQGDLKFLRKRIQHMENRELVAVSLALLAMLLALVSYIVMQCLYAAKSGRITLYNYGISNVVLLVSSCLITIILSI